jgi:rRNA maturation endonuclease Nob1
MAVPKRTDIMIRNAMKRNAKVDNLGCKKQFPDCPNEPNKEFCKVCPLWK